MKQEGLITFEIEALGLDVGTMTWKGTLAKAKSLATDMDGEVAHGGFSYSNIVGILLYLSGHSESDITYAVKCVACCMYGPRQSHELALKRIGRQLTATC